MSNGDATPPRRALIEQWFPVETISAESMRDVSAGEKPPLNRLHIWWARRPLTTARATLLASVLPTWSSDWPPHLKSRFPNEASYRAWFLEACGIFGNPMDGWRRLRWSKQSGRKWKGPLFTYRRAFETSPSEAVLKDLEDICEFAWGRRQLRVIDPFSGGGSIPFEAMRYGFETTANELNPVANVVLRATLQLPIRFGDVLVGDLNRWGMELAKRVEKRLAVHFPKAQGETIQAYVWARTVPCPYTGKPLPLLPNWWLIKKGAEPVAIKATFDPKKTRATFAIVTGKKACAALKPEEGTVRRGNARSPWEGNQPVDGDYIKAEARKGNFRQQLITVALKKPGGFVFRAPTESDEAATAKAEAALAELRPKWKASGIYPDDKRYIGPSDRLDTYGVHHFDQLFLPRQLLSQCVIVEEFQAIAAEILADGDEARQKAVVTLLSLVVDKAADYNSAQCVWDVTRQKVAHTFNLHDFRIRWNPGEFDVSRNLVPWCVDQVADAWSGICRLARLSSDLPSTTAARTPPSIRTGSATRLSGIADRSIDHISVDPPYYDNVIYSECADFFYVWLKRTLGDVHPELFDEALTNKDDEAVANTARFKDVEAIAKKRHELAAKDYERKMGLAFREMHRVLRDDGVLTVMFTHKSAAAWDTLATSLIGAGFAIRASWPVHTESEHSLHVAKKNAAQSTILLVCRKRAAGSGNAWWDDLKETVRTTARAKAAEFEAMGIRGVDLYIATFGPTLSILSERWPVLTSEVDAQGDAKPLRPEVALDLAREEVLRLRKRGLLLGREVRFDPVTDWYLMAWDAFKAVEFPADEARKLALALGLDVEKQLAAGHKLIAKKQSTVTLRSPSERRTAGVIDPRAKDFPILLDAAHTAMLVCQTDGTQAARAFLVGAGLTGDARFVQLIQALINAVPRVRKKGGAFVREEATALEDMRLAIFRDLTAPKEDEPPADEGPRQLSLAGVGAAPDESEGGDDDGDADDEEDDDA